MKTLFYLLINSYPPQYSISHIAPKQIHILIWVVVAYINCKEMLMIFNAEVHKNFLTFHEYEIKKVYYNLNSSF